LALYNHWLRASGKTPALYNAKSDAIFHKLPTYHGALHYFHAALSHFGWLIMIFSYLGVFTFPLLLLTRRPALKGIIPFWMGRALLIFVGGISTIAVIKLVVKHQIMPIGGNILIAQGIGPLTLRDTYVLGLDNVPSLPTFFWIVVTILSVLGMFELVFRIATYVTNVVAEKAFARQWPLVFGVDETVTLFVFVSISAYCLPLILAGGIFDRYLIPILPLALFFLASISKSNVVDEFRAFIAAALCLVIAIFAVLGEHDYMAWNRARWTAIGYLQANDFANPATLDGGFEYNGLFNYDPNYITSDNKSWWWIDKDDYQLSFGPIVGMKTIKEFPYETLLPPAKRQILVLRADSILNGTSTAPLPPAISR
jgi:hypothetical protein